MLDIKYEKTGIMSNIIFENYKILQYLCQKLMHIERKYVIIFI